MIYIEKDQLIPENPTLRVFAASGDYSDLDQIEYYDPANPETALGAFQAQFIKYGGLVYRFNDPRELGAEILRTDPESTHNAASFVRMSNQLLKQMGDGSLEPASLDKALGVEQAATEEKMADVPVDPEAPDAAVETATSTPAVITEGDEPVQATSTPAYESTPGTVAASTTPQTQVDPSGLNPPQASTTPVSLIPASSTTTPPYDIDISSTTPSTYPIESSTTTPDVVAPDTTEVPVNPGASDILSAPTPVSTTTDEIVTYAKKKIVKKLFNI